MKVTQLPTTPNAYRPPQSAVPIKIPKASGVDIGKILSRFETDDYILAGIILVLIFEGCDDYILLAALGYLFLMGLKE